MPSNEMVSLLQTLGSLSIIDQGYTKAWSIYITSLLSGQPKALEGQHTAVFSWIGRVLAFSSITGSELVDLALNCAKTIPKKLRMSMSQEILITGPMWARIAETKLGLVPQTILTELLHTVTSFSLPKIIASREAVQNCTTVVDVALRMILAQEKAKTTKTQPSPLRTPTIKLCETIWSNLETIRRIANAESLEKHTLRALTSLNFVSSITRILAVLEDSDRSWPVQSKKEALKSLMREVNPSLLANGALQRTLFEAVSEHLSSHPQSALASLCSEIRSSLASSRLFDDSIPTLDTRMMSFGSYSVSSLLSPMASCRPSTQAKSSTTCSVPSLKIVCPTQVDSTSETDDRNAIVSSALQTNRVELVCQYFDEMASADAILEVFNKLPLDVLEKLDDFLCRSSAFEKKENLENLQRLLQHNLDLKEGASGSGWFKYYQRFESRPKAQKEALLLVLKEPKLLTHSFFLYHLHQLSPAVSIPPLQASVNLSREIRAPQPNAEIEDTTITPSPPPPTSAMDVTLVEEDDHENLKKRKELALKMIDDLEETEGAFSPAKRPSPLRHSDPSMELNLVNIVDHPIDLTESRSTRDKTSLGGTDDMNTSDAPTSPRLTRSRAKPSATPKVSAASKKTGAKNAKKSGNGEETFVAEDSSSKSTDVPSAPANGKKTSAKKQALEKKKAEPFRKVVCNHWLQHRCYKGDDCTFLHEGVQTTFDSICKFFRTGNCTKGAACPFSHDLKTEACSNLVTTGNCKFGVRCLYSHEPDMIAGAKNALETRKKEEEALKADQEKEKSLSFAQHLVPLAFQPPLMESPFSPSSFQPSYAGSYTSYLTDATEQSASMDADGGYPPEEPQERVQAPSSNPETGAAYVPPTLVGLSGAPFVPNPIAIPTSSLLPPPSLSSHPTLKPPTL